ncbi:hypothetical protein BB560_002872 [Smittium megazygosporum]|uniref:Acyl-CoA thioesterase-like C-terminal domain-containing protein n=1 Tax=Smittium megazygosporum TaxID=133381 RepID=A0A2T9ZDP2_9FUNG|nr:hypothetical protein BB560_002872 [Smittium megazygosporum]
MASFEKRSLNPENTSHQYTMPDVYPVDSTEKLTGIVNPNSNMWLPSGLTVDERTKVMGTIDVDARLAVPRSPTIRKNFDLSVNKHVSSLLEQNKISKTDIRMPYIARWIKVNCEEQLEINVHLCMIACLSDYRVLATAGLPHFWGYNFEKQDFGMTVSLDHTLHFHMPVKANSWLLWVIESPRLSNERGYVTGRFFDEQGVLVASVVQEALIRAKPKPNAIKHFQYKSFPPVMENSEPDRFELKSTNSKL